MSSTRITTLSRHGAWMAVAWVALAGCPKPIPGAEQNDGTIRRIVDDGEDPRTERMKEHQQRLKAVGEKRKLERARFGFVHDRERGCETTADCTLVPEHCCACQQGGRIVPVARKWLPTLLQRRAVVCDTRECAQRVSDDPSCQAKSAACVEGMCELVIPEGAAATEGIGVEPIADDPADGAPTKKGR